MHTIAWDGTATDRIHVSTYGSHRSFSCAEHDHAGFWELTCVRQGTLLHTVGGEPLRQGPGTVTLLREGDRHSLAGERMAFANISFSTAFVPGLALLPRLPEDCLDLLTRPGPVYGRLPAARCGEFLAACDRLGMARGAADEGLLLLGLLSEALRACHVPRAPPAAPGPPWLERILPLLDGEDEVGDLRDLIRRAGVGHEHLARTLRRRLDLTPSGFLNRCRIHRAARLLATTDLPMTEIALRTGYADAGYFARVFARHRGMAPSAWRRQEQRFIQAG